MTRTDEELVSAYRHGEREAMDELVGRYLKPIHAFIRRLANDSPDAEDITQEAFVKAWRNLGGFNVSRRFRPWIFRIAKNATTDHFRKKRALPFSAFDDEEGNNAVTDSLVDLAPLPDELLHRSDIGETLLKTLNRLPPTYREVLLLRHDSCLSFEEISEILKSPVNTVKSRHRRGLLILRDRLKDDPTISRNG